MWFLSDIFGPFGLTNVKKLNNLRSAIILMVSDCRQFHHSTTQQQIFQLKAQTLLRYGEKQTDVEKKQQFFQQFYQQFEKFAMRDFSQLKKHHEKILDQIAEIIESQTFIECLRPDLHDIRHLRGNLKIEKGSEYEQSRQSWSGSKVSTPMKQSRFDYVDSVKSQKSQQKSSSKEESVQKKLQQLYNSIRKSYQDHSLDDAFRKVQQYLTLSPNTALIPQQKSNFLRNVSDQYQTMSNFYLQFDKGGWIFDKEENGITLQYKIDEQQNMIEIRINGEGEIPIQPFLAIISEIDLMGDYVPFCYDCSEIKKISRNQRIGHSKIYIPLLSDRETYMYAAGYDRIHTTKSLFFFSKTINQDLVYQKKYNFTVPQQSKYVRLEYKYFIIEYIPITVKKAKIRLASKIDLKMDFVPKFILFRSARIFAFDYFKNIIDRIKNFKGSAWEQKIKDNPDMYKFFRRKLDQYFHK